MFFLFGRKKTKKSIIPTKIKEECKKLKIKLTKKTSKGNNARKSIKELMKEIKLKKIKRTKSRFGLQRSWVPNIWGPNSIYYPYGWDPNWGYHITQGGDLEDGPHATGPSGAHYGRDGWWNTDHMDEDEQENIFQVWDDYESELR